MRQVILQFSRVSGNGGRFLASPRFLSRSRWVIFSGLARDLGRNLAMKKSCWLFCRLQT